MAVPIWNENSKSYLVETKPDVKDRVEVIIGDDQDPSVFHPQMKLQRWDNEANVSFRLDSAWIPGVKIENDEANGVITWKKKVGQNEWIARFYEDWGTPEGAYKFVELVLPDRPPVNSISFSVVSKDVDFFYQPALTRQEIDDGAERPDEVVGSYAIYSKSSGGLNRADGKEYKVGKVGHLYRAKIIDANGNETWGDYNTDLNDTGILTLSVDPTWLDNAVYPVVVDPTFGYTSIGGTDDDSTSDLIIGTAFTAPANISVSKIAFYVHSDANDDGPSALGIYQKDSSGSNSHGFIGNTAEFTPTPNNWNLTNLASSANLSNATDYYLVHWGEEHALRYDTTSGTYIRDANNYPASWLDPLPATNSTTRIYSAYIPYTVTPAGEILDSYSVSNQSFGVQLGDLYNGSMGQSFTGNNGTLEAVQFNLKLSNFFSAGTAVVKIYAHTGTYGTSSEPTGTALATSASIDISSFDPADYNLETFVFSGSDRITLSSATYYVAQLEVSTATSLVLAGYDDNSPGHDGNINFGGTANSGYDACFYVYYTAAAAETVEDKSFMTTNSKFWGG